MSATASLRLSYRIERGTPAEELEADDVPFAEGFGRFRRIGLHQAGVTVRQVYRKEVDLLLHPADHRQRFAEVDLCVPRLVSQRHGRIASRLPRAMIRWRLGALPAASVGGLA